ncbi:GNAT family N-acetyltransferase, partial [Glutamicibacter ardleyensis]|uniref:GNAT family N-acetyltransferase n=1 Tax=Glutamicibacter ardleyensis TaxID=225894 RepID=UPI003FD28F9B
GSPCRTTCRTEGVEVPCALMAFMIRAAQVDDVRLLPGIERAADTVFVGEGMASIADGETMPIHVFLQYQNQGRAWVDTDDFDQPVAYLLLDLIDDVAHIEQVSVLPTHAGLGIGRQLIGMAAEWARQQGYAALTLTTFAEVPWNAPYYARLGFDIVPTSQLSPGLRRIREHEASIGLDQWPRVAMRCPLVG